MNSITTFHARDLLLEDSDALREDDLRLHPELLPAPGHFDDAEARQTRHAVVRQHVTQLLAHVRRRSGKRRVAEYVARDLDLESFAPTVVRTANQNARTQ